MKTWNEHGPRQSSFSKVVRSEGERAVLAQLYASSGLAHGAVFFISLEEAVVAIVMHACHLVV